MFSSKITGTPSSSPTMYLISGKKISFETLQEVRFCR
ncbi:unnamed protein product, partial [Allacma fusca]